MSAAPPGGGRASAVVPTLGTSPHLGRCLAALRADGGEALEILVVAQRTVDLAAGDRGAVEAARGLADVWVESPRNLGFAGGTNLGIAVSRGEWVATVNDDALVRPGWLAALRAALEDDPRAAAAQGVNLRLADPATLDGRGLARNRWWQAVQLGHGEPAGTGLGREGGAAGGEVSGGDEGGAAGGELSGGRAAEVFGASATAALFRRAALDEVALPGAGSPAVFDPRLGSWYEDADLAGRLRAAGWRALSVPTARALHAGTATGARRRLRRLALLHGNRHLVAARLLGRGYLAALPRMALRDLVDLVRAAGRADPLAAAGVLAGYLRAARHLPAYLRPGPPALPRAELRRLAAERAR